LVVAYVSTNFATMCFCGGISVEKMQGLASWIVNVPVRHSGA
jgi:hypothetical protein